MSDRAYLARVRTLPCCACGSTIGIHAHHQTGAGLALKADDRQTMPLCNGCHVAFHDARGVFRNWDRELKRDWQRAMVAFTQRVLGVGVAVELGAAEEVARFERLGKGAANG